MLENECLLMLISTLLHRLPGLKWRRRQLSCRLHTLVRRDGIAFLYRMLRLVASDEEEQRVAALATYRPRATNIAWRRTEQKKRKPGHNSREGATSVGWLGRIVVHSK